MKRGGKHCVAAPRCRHVAASECRNVTNARRFGVAAGKRRAGGRGRAAEGQFLTGEGNGGRHAAVGSAAVGRTARRVNAACPAKTRADAFAAGDRHDARAASVR